MCNWVGSWFLVSEMFLVFELANQIVLIPFAFCQHFGLFILLFPFMPSSIEALLLPVERYDITKMVF